MPIPMLHPAMRAAVDEEIADVRDLVHEYPAWAVMLQTAYCAPEAARFVTVDLLARLAEVADQSSEKQLLLLTARLHAWESVTR